MYSCRVTRHPNDHRMSAITPDTPDSPDTHEGTAFSTLGPDARAYERYAQVDLDEETLLLYDIDEEAAWISSDTVVSLSETA